MGTIHLVRHGQASAGTDDYDRLSERGEYQANLLGLWWKQQGFEADHAAFGTLKRQRDTARIALEAAALKPAEQVHAKLDEYDHRLVETRYAHAAANDNPESLNFNDYQAIMQRWRDATAGEAQAHQELNAASDAETPESWDQFSRRGWQAVQEIHKQIGTQKTLLVFTSGGIIANVLAQVLELDFAHTIDAIWRTRNASITSLTHDGDQARLIEFNTVPHLQSRFESDLITLI